MTLTPQQIQLIVDYFTTQPVVTVYLFGSYARGTADRESDLDLVVEYDFDRPERLDVSVCKKELGKRLALRVDAYQLHRVLKYAKTSISKEWVQIYPPSDGGFSARRTASSSM